MSQSQSPFRLVPILFCALSGMLFTACSGEKLPEGFVYATDVIPDLIVDLRYYSNDNFIGTRIDGYRSDKLILTEAAATALAAVQNELITTYQARLKVYDAYRPQRAVDHFVRWAKDPADTLMKSQYYPNVPKDSLFALGYIAAKSGHSRGSTVDLTMVYGEESGLKGDWDMGTPWDYFGPESGIHSDAVSLGQQSARATLRNIMYSHGFKSLDEEWWHFTLMDEPFPDTYFDFEVR